MDRNIYSLGFINKSSPDWICPTCEKGILRFNSNTFNFRETSQSYLRREAISDYDQEFIYCCILKCTNDQCNEAVSNIGTGVLVYDELEGWVHVFTPKYFEPNLKLIKIPRNCPTNISKALNESFKIFFSNINATANILRITIEELLTSLKVPHTNPPNLHKRISNLNGYNDIKDMLFAVKLIGNDGSHDLNTLKIDDIYDAYELIEYVLEEIYEEKQANIKAITKRINSKNRKG